MKTFDIAYKYLSEIDFSKFDVFNPDQGNSKELESINEQIGIQANKFMNDETNAQGNEHYRNMVLGACMYHLLLKAQQEESFWEAACNIIISNIEIVKGKYEGIHPDSIYPKLMMDKFNDYCDKLDPLPSFLAKEAELREGFFMAAFHYVLDENA